MLAHELGCPDIVYTMDNGLEFWIHTDKKGYMAWITHWGAVLKLKKYFPATQQADRLDWRAILHWFRANGLKKTATSSLQYWAPSLRKST